MLTQPLTRGLLGQSLPETAYLRFFSDAPFNIFVGAHLAPAARAGSDGRKDETK